MFRRASRAVLLAAGAFLLVVIHRPAADAQVRITIREPIPLEGVGTVTPGTYTTGTWYRISGAPTGTVVRFNENNTFNVNFNYLGGNRVCETCYLAQNRPVPSNALAPAGARPLPAPLPAQQTFLSPFSKTTLQQFFNTFIGRAVQSLQQFFAAVGPAPGAGRVSRFTTPDPTYLGYGGRERYSPPDPRNLMRLLRPLGGERQGRTTTSERDGKPPTPIPDVPSEGIPGGGRPGDPFWAEDCSCVSSRGKAPGVVYFAPFGDRCPEDPLLPCEACRRIKRHDNYVSTVAECQQQTIGDQRGGSPRAPFFGL